SPEARNIKSELDYLFKILNCNQNTKFDLLVTEQQTEYSIGVGAGHTFTISENFVKRKISKDDLNGQGFFESNGQIDYITTAFFCLSSWQEHEDKEPDALGRFQYKNSYQFKLGNIRRNIVQECFDAMAARLGLQSRHEKSTFFLSHDIDTVYGAIKEDGFNVIKKGRFDLFLSMLFKVAIGKPAWLNIDHIMDLESAYDCRSTFYWIVNKAQKDADYQFQSPRMQKYFKNVSSRGFDNGLHKSLSGESFQQEIEKLGVHPLGNRYHFLKFHLPEGYDALENAQIQLDASLGFSEQWGFRNNYGLPYNPYNMAKRAPYNFVEVPLHIMDRTFFHKRMDLRTVENEIFSFFEAHNENAVLSILWHNNFFTDYKYKGYLSLYKKILAFIRDGNFGTINQEQIIQKYSIDGHRNPTVAVK
ncbi:MAG: DUF7033 domain-containing protein, partial [Bacteroidota bacterium]